MITTNSSKNLPIKSKATYRMRANFGRGPNNFFYYLGHIFLIRLLIKTAVIVPD